MDEFYKFLRQIQKKERDKSTLASVEENFYESIHNYLDELRKTTSNDPFAPEYALLKESQVIATEICQRREYKISNSAVSNIQRSYHLFTGKPKFDILDTTPINLTPEEEKFYFSIIDTLKNHRDSISLDKLNKEDFEEENDDINNKKLDIKTIKKPSIKKPSIKKISKEKTEVKDEVLESLESIKSAKVVTDEKREPIEKQILNSQDNEFPDIPEYTEDQFHYESINKKSIDNKETVLIFDELGAIMGVDEKIYGPFRKQDVVVMPNENAKVFIRNRKARIIKI